jgi:hypothetical protein
VPTNINHQFGDNCEYFLQYEFTADVNTCS